MNWWHRFKQEARQMFITDRRRAIFLFGAPLAYLILFSLLYGTHAVKAVPLVIYDEDQTRFSRSLIQTFDDSERFQIIDYVTEQEDMEYELHEKITAAAVHIPKKFAQDAKSGRSATVLLIADGANIIITNTVTTTAQEIIASFAKETGARLTEINTGQLPSMAVNKTGPVDFRLRVLNNPTQSYLAFFVIGLAMAALQQGIFLSTGASIFSKFDNLDEMKAARPLSVMAGKLLPYWISAILAFFLTIIATIHLFGVPCKTTLTSFLLLSAAFVSAAIGLSALIASICNSELTFTRISIAYTVPAFVLSGYTWPPEAMDIVGRTLFYTFPLSYFSGTVRELMLSGYSPFLGRNSLILLLLGLVFTYIAMLCYSRRINRTPSTPNFSQVSCPDSSIR